MTIKKEIKQVFVIMPFEKANDRDRSDLDEFYNKGLKDFIEAHSDLGYKYQVIRSGSEFNMQKSIILNLREADIVICDLSGTKIPNPNVMFELGIRFSISQRPVILCRELTDINESIFDVGWLNIHLYKATQLSTLQTYILEKLQEYEVNPRSYDSPVLDLLGSDFAVEKEAKKNDIIRCLEGVFHGLRAVSLHIINSIGQYLNQLIGENPLPVNLDDFIEWWSQNQDILEKYDWSNFSFELRSFSPLEHLLVDVKIADYLPDKIRSTIPTLLMKYYVKYVACSYTKQNDFLSVSNLILETGTMGAIAGFLSSFISEDNDKKRLEIYDSLVNVLNDYQYG